MQKTPALAGNYSCVAVVAAAVAGVYARAAYGDDGDADVDVDVREDVRAPVDLHAALQATAGKDASVTNDAAKAVHSAHLGADLAVRVARRHVGRSSAKCQRAGTSYEQSLVRGIMARETYTKFFEIFCHFFFRGSANVGCCGKANVLRYSIEYLNFPVVLHPLLNSRTLTVWYPEGEFWAIC